MQRRSICLSSVSRTVFFAGLLLLVIAWLAVILIDGYALLPLPGWMTPFPEHPALALSFFFGEAADYRPAVVENAQILLLATSTLVALLLSHRTHRAGNTGGTLPALLLTGGLALMYINDGHNVRHDITAALSTAWYGTPDFPLRNPLRVGFELAFYAFIASFMLGAAWVAWRRRTPLHGSLPYLLGGYIAYAVASFASATRYFGNWYDRAGYALLSVFPEDFARRLEGLPSSDLNNPYPPEFWLMDWWIEESIELLGALCLFRAACILLDGHTSEREEAPSAENPTDPLDSPHGTNRTRLPSGKVTSQRSIASRNGSTASGSVA